MLQAKLRQIPDFPESLKTLVEHLIISHHGQYDFGSPKLPMFPEALMLHYLDDLDSKMEAMRAQFERGGESEGAWSGYNPSLGRPVLNTAKFLATKTVEEEEQIASDPPPPASGKIAELGGTPRLAGLEPSELEPKENSAAAMTSAAHKDKI
jgi:3'-5' exoribonuclease